VSSIPQNVPTAPVPLPRDELATRRERKLAPQLTPAQVRRLLTAAALREKATQGENDE